MRKSLRSEGKYGDIGPYDLHPPKINRPTQDGLTRPCSYDEQIYCWYHWIRLILDPARTREVLNDLEKLPEFKATWGANWEKGNQLYLKTH